MSKLCKMELSLEETGGNFRAGLGNGIIACVGVAGTCQRNRTNDSDLPRQNSFVRQNKAVGLL